MKVLIGMILLIAVLYSFSEFLNIYPSNIDISIFGLRIKIDNKEKQPKGGSTPLGRKSKKLK